MTRWEYARLEYRRTGHMGTDRFEDWSATLYTPAGVQKWGTDERFDDLRHLNRAGGAGWQAYDRGVLLVHGEPYKMHVITYSLRRPVE